MPFVGKLITTGERVDITRLKCPKEELRAGEIACQSCEQPLIIKHGFIIRAHFAHKAECDGPLKSHPESPEHIAGKELVADCVKREFAEYSTARVEFEWPLPEVARIADVAFLFPSGWIVAHEVQLASITPQELKERTEDYLRAGVDVVWWLGKSADTQANREWCLSYFGYCVQFDFQFIQRHVRNRAGAA